ncbi:mitochondrial acidic protein Mam33p [Trichomonascus vanleenenianus]|uniref:Mam33p n=1 Tax=Trichomonascus vanleenenianus TaxID=2268995 RepID=UPI003EC9CBB6
MLRQAIKLSTRTIVRSAVRPAVSTAARASVARIGARSFAVTCQRFNKSSLTAADAELVSILKKEIELETEIDQTEALGSSVVDKFLKESGFEVIAKDGSDMIELVKKEGNEVVHVYFSLFDVTSDEALFDEEGAEEGAAEEGMEEFEEEDIESPIRAKVVVEKPGKSALTVETTIHDDLFLVQYVIPSDPALAVANTAEADHERRQQYQGPIFSTLDPNVQSGIERYLEARGVNSEMASFIVEYAAARENKEYIRWLKQLQKVVEA